AASVSDDRPRTILWKVGPWEKLRELPVASGEHGAILFSADNRVLVSNDLRLWDLTTGVGFPPEANEDWAGTWADISPDDKYLVTLNHQGNVKFLGLAPRKL